MWAIFMWSSVRLTATLLGLALLCAWTPPVRAAENIVLSPLELSGGLEPNRADIEGAVVKGLAVAGRPVLVAADAQGTYVVSGSVARDGTSFKVTFHLLRTADNFTLNRQENNCDVADCSVAELARRSARELVRQTLGRPAEGGSLPPAAVAGTTGGGGGGEESTVARPRLLGGLAVAAGAVALGVGVYLVVIDGQCASSAMPGHTCAKLNSTLAGGIASIAGGLAAAAGGAYLLIRDGSRSGGATVAVGVRPAGLLVAGRF
jgi:hypothetical protein